MERDLLKIKEQLKKNDLQDKDSLFSVAEEIFKKQIINVGTISYIELFQEATLGMGQYYHALRSEIPVDENVEVVYKKLMAYASELPSILGNFNERMIDIMELRKETIQHIRLLSAYYTEYNYIYEIVSERIAVRELEGSELKGIQLNTFYQDMAKYMAKDPQKIPHKMSYILSVLPFRLTKQYFLSRVEDILKRVKEDSPTNGWHTILQRYKEHFDGSSYILYGKYFDKFRQKIQDYSDMDFRKISVEDLKSIQKETGAILDNLTRLIQTFQSYCSITNRILVLNMIEFKDFERVFEGDIVIPEIYKRFTEAKWLVEKESDESTPERLEELYETCRKRVAELYQQASDLGGLFSTCIDKLSGDINDKIEEYITLSQRIMAVTNDYENEEYDQIISVAVDEGNYDNGIREFIAYLEERIQHMSTDSRRARMRKLFSVLPVPFQSPEEFFDYMKSSLEFNTSDPEKIWTMDRVYKIMQMELK